MKNTNFLIFCDMDGVLVDFDRYTKENGITPEEVKQTEGAYRYMQPIPGALDGIRKLASLAGQYGGEVWLATKPPTGLPFAYADKVHWVLEHLPELNRRIILTHNKGLLGKRGDFLIDDRPHRANCDQFQGSLMHFGPDGLFADWPQLLEAFKSLVSRMPFADHHPV